MIWRSHGLSMGFRVISIVVLVRAAVTRDFQFEGSA